MDGRGQHRAASTELPEADKHLECHEPRPLCRPAARAGHPVARRSGEAHRPAGAGGHLRRPQHGGRRARARSRSSWCSQQLPKPVNFSGGMEPLTIGGTFTLAEIVGTVPVEPDGSAYIEVPALRSLFFVALDENDIAGEADAELLHRPAGRDDQLRRLPRAADPDAALQAATWRPCGGRPARSSRSPACPTCSTSPATSSRSSTSTASSATTPTAATAGST